MNRQLLLLLLAIFLGSVVATPADSDPPMDRLPDRLPTEAPTSPGPQPRVDRLPDSVPASKPTPPAPQPQVDRLPDQLPIASPTAPAPQPPVDRLPDPLVPPAPPRKDLAAESPQPPQLPVDGMPRRMPVGAPLPSEPETITTDPRPLQQPPEIVQQPSEQLPVPRPIEPVPTIDPFPCTPTVEKTYCATLVHLVEEQKLKMVPNAALREVIARVPAMDVQVEYREEKQSCIVMVLKPREVEQQVTTIATLPHVSVDPCTGCSHIEYEHVPVCKTVKVTIFEQVPERREYVVKVPVLRCVEKELQYRQVALDLSPRPEVHRRYQAIVLPVKATVQVPICPVPLPPEPEPASPMPPERP